MRSTNVDQVLLNISGMSLWLSETKGMTLGVPKPYGTRSYDVSSFLTIPTLFVFVFDSTNFPQNSRNHSNCWYRQKRWDIVWARSIRFWNAQRSYFWSLKATGTSLICWVTLGHICWPHCWLKLAEIWVLLIHLSACSS